jgi:cytochrome c biogenesis protein CcmG/thiol:disulfide interchange protein DsbE
MSTGWRRGLLLSAVAAAVLSVAALLATGLGRDPAVVASPLVGRAAPAFKLAGLDGPAVRMSDLRGQVVVVNFWASWCVECRTEQNALNTTWSRFRDSGVTVLGVNFQDTTSEARNYVGSLGISYPVVQDTESSTALAYGLRGVPETFVVDKAGRIADRVIGPVSAQRLADRINTLLQAADR